MMIRRFSIAAVWVGVLLLGGSLAVRAVVAPAIVRFPLDTDETAHYTGHTTLFVDAKTLLPLAEPRMEPLSISRRVDTVSGSFAKAVVQEIVTVDAGSTRTVEKYQYVLDRRSMKMVNDPRQYAFGKRTAVMHAAGGYRITFAMGTKLHGSYLAYIPEADALVRLVPLRAPHYHGDAHVSVVDFSSRLEKPVAPYYLAHLEAMGLPMQVTAAQLEPLLRANGIDVNQALADVGPQLTPTESQLVSSTLSKSVPLRYFFIDNGTVSIEPKTGALIDVHAQEQGVAVKPDLSGASALQSLLDKYAAIPSVKSLSDGLAALAKRRPQVAETYVYSQTVASSLHAAAVARKDARMIDMVEVRLPLAMLVLGSGALACGLFGWRRTRRMLAAAEGPSASSAPPAAGPPGPPGPPTAPAPRTESSPEPRPDRTYEGV